MCAKVKVNSATGKKVKVNQGPSSIDVNPPPPVSLTNSIIVCDGNSLTEGYLASSGAAAYPAVLGTLAPFSTNGATIYNYGVGGQTTRQMAADKVSQIYPLYNPAKSCIYIAWEIGNDLRFQDVNTTYAQCITEYVNLCTAVRAQGFKVVAVTVPCRQSGVGSNFSWEADRLNANIYIRANYTSWADVLCDIGGDSRFNSVAATANTTYYNADTIHFTDTGYALVADFIKTALLAL